MSSHPPNDPRRPGGSTQRREPTHSQLFPVFTKGQELLKRSFFVPAIVSLVAIIALFATVNDNDNFNNVLGVYLGLIVMYAVVRVTGTTKPWWVLGVAAAMTGLATLVLMVVEPGRPCPQDVSASIFERLVAFVIMFFFHFLLAGVPEEVIKAVPVLLAAFATGSLVSPWREKVGVFSPLDGIAIGAASGLGFTLVETLGKYVQEVTVGCSPLAGTQLLIPRVVGGLVTHMAWSGYLGYYIGLARDSERRMKILGLGYLSAAALHAFWNSSEVMGSWLSLISGALTLALLGSAILKARQLAGVRSSVVSEIQTSVPRGSTPSPVSPRIAQIPASGPAWFLRVGTRQVSLSVGTRIRDEEIAGLVAQGSDGIVAEINQNPADASMIGLKNLSVNAWSVLDPKSGVRKVQPGQSARLLPGTRINFGSIFGEVGQ